MIKKIAICFALISPIVSIAALFQDIPEELKYKVISLYLYDMQISYKEGSRCIAVIGKNREGQKAAYVAIKYMAGDLRSRWSDFASIPFDQRNDEFGLFQQGEKIVVLQSCSKLNHENATGYSIEFDYDNARIVLQPIVTRMGESTSHFSESFDDRLIFLSE